MSWTFGIGRGVPGLRDGPMGVAVRYRVVIRTALAAVIISSAPLAPATGRSPAMGPHDVGRTEFDVQEYWLPRHRAQIARRGLSPNDVGRVQGRARGFSNPKRVSADLLAPPPAELVGAQAETQTEPYLAVNPEDPDNLLAGWQEHRFRDGGARALGFAVSTNGGKKWSEGRVPGLTSVDGGPWDRASDPWPAFGPGGVAYYSSLLVTDAGIDGPNAIAVSRSEDGGATWGDPVEVHRSAPDFNDKNSMVVDTTASRYRGNVYVSWDINLAGPGGFVGVQKMVLARSTDGGRTYGRVKTLHKGFINVGIIARVGPDGTVYAIWSSADSRDDPNLSIVFAKSVNGGRKWTEPIKIADLLPVGVSGVRGGFILPSFDIDPVAGTLYVAWADARFTGVDQAAIIVSADGGDTWTDPARVNDGPADRPVFTIGVAAKAGGGVIVGYYERQRPPDFLQLGYTTNLSEDGGASFGPGVRVSRKSFCGCAAATVGSDSTRRTIFLGDYVGLAGGGDRFFALYTGTHKKSLLQHGHQPDIFAARSR